MSIIAGVLNGLQLALQGSTCLCVEVDLQLSSGEEGGPASCCPSGHPPADPAAFCSCALWLIHLNPAAEEGVGAACNLQNRICTSDGCQSKTSNSLLTNVHKDQEKVFVEVCPKHTCLVHGMDPASGVDSALSPSFSSC